MSSFRVRPRFSQVLDWGLEEAQERIARAVEATGGRVVLKRFPGYLTLRIPERDQQFWSPQLVLSLERRDDGRTAVEGIYGPNTNVWSLYLYGYLLVGSVGTFAAIFGFCQRALGALPWGLWLAGAMLVLAAAFYLIAQFGQKLAAWQTFQLHQAYEAAVGKPAEVR
jgi:hypothetical protein